jgi:predicted acetyltransferase
MKEIINEYGKWIDYGTHKVLVEPTEEYYNKNKPTPEQAEADIKLKIKVLTSEIDILTIIDILIAKNIIKSDDIPSEELNKITEIKTLKAQINKP